MARFGKPKNQRTIVGAASRLPTQDAKKLVQAWRAPVEWQTEAWEFFDTVPELKFATNWVGNLVAKVRLYVAVLNDEGEPVPVTDELSGVGAAEAVELEAMLALLAGSMGGQADIQRELAVNLDVAGECHLIGWAPTETEPREVWEVRSVSELSSKGDVLFVKGSPDAKAGRSIGPDDDVVRCFVRHPRWSDLPDTNVKALMTELRSLQVLSQQVMAESMSRANAGLLLLPNELSFGSEGTGAGDEPGDGADDEQDDPFLHDLTEAVTRPIQDPSDPSSVVPMLVRGAAEWLDKIRLVSLGREGGEVLDKRIEYRVMRIARGLNVPVEVVMGHRDTTYANAQQISEDEFTDHLEPRVLLLADLLTVGYLRPKVTDRALAERVFIWYDATSLLDPPDQSAAADEAFDRIAISPEAYRAAKGFTEDQKPTSDDAMMMLVTRKGIISEALAGALLRYVDPSFVAPPPAPSGQGDAITAAIIAAQAGQTGALRALSQVLGLDSGGWIDASGTDGPGNPLPPRG